MSSKLQTLSTFGALALFMASVVCHPVHRFPRQAEEVATGETSAAASVAAHGASVGTDTTNLVFNFNNYSNGTAASIKPNGNTAGAAASSSTLSATATGEYPYGGSSLTVDNNDASAEGTGTISQDFRKNLRHKTFPKQRPLTYRNTNETAAVGTGNAELYNSGTTYNDGASRPTSSISNLHLDAVATVDAASTHQGGAGNAGSTSASGSASGGTTTNDAATVANFLGYINTDSTGIVVSNAEG